MLAKAMSHRMTRDTIFRIIAAVLAVLLLGVAGVLVFTDATLVGSAMDALWMGGVFLLLFSTFTTMAISGPRRAHDILVRGMRFLGMAGDEAIPETLGQGGEARGRELTGLDDGEEAEGQNPD